MKPFMDEDFLLHSETAKTLFHTYAEHCPIIDYHNHLSPRDICEKRRFENLTQLWLGADHYKWRAMRTCGVEERRITGDAEDYEKFCAWASVLPQLVGNPLYHWTHLELQRYFGIFEPLNSASAPWIWEQTRTMLAGEGYDAVSLLERRRVQALCTTDDPADTLEWHQAIRADASIPFRVLPSFRPDRYLAPESEGWRGALERLGVRYGLRLDSFDQLKKALVMALDFFCENGCKISDHGLPHFAYGAGDPEWAFQRALRGERLSAQEIADYKGGLLRFLGGEYEKRGVAMQLHLGPIRDNSPRLLSGIGPDAGGDSVGELTDPFALGAFLGELEQAGSLPRTVLYGLNPADNTVLSTMAVNFAPRIQYGAAWWFQDHLRGIRNQLDELMETGLLTGSVGMLTDSRSFTSFVRHEYYRRILCDHIASIVEDGQYPNDMEELGGLVQRICYENAMTFFAL